MRSWKDLKPQGTINLLYSSVKVVPNAPKRHTFQVITHQDRTYTLQGDDMDEWMEAIQHSTALLLDAMTPQEKSGGGTERAMRDNRPRADGGTGDADGSAEDTQTPFEKLMSLEANRKCADCGAADPEWASINLAVTICIECSGIHRSLGTHITKVRSAKLDSDVWDAEMIAYMMRIGNARANLIWEGGVPPRISKPEHGDTLDMKKEWVTEKYQRRRFVKPSPRYAIGAGAAGGGAAAASSSSSPGGSPAAASDGDVRDLLVRLNNDLLDAIEARDLDTAYACFVYGADINAPRPGDPERRPPLHVAVASGDATAVQMLVSNGAMPDAPDARGWLPIHHAARCNAVAAAKILMRSNGRLIDAKTREGDTAIDIATVERAVDVEPLLLSLKMHQVQMLIDSNNASSKNQFTTF
jgi:Arf-GAP/coiled-coil/ANK repeat/PH domain-containing protein